MLRVNTRWCVHYNKMMGAEYSPNASTRAKDVEGKYRSVRKLESKASSTPGKTTSPCITGSCSLLQRFVTVASDYAVQYLLKVSQYLDSNIKVSVNSTASFAGGSSVTRL